MPLQSLASLPDVQSHPDVRGIPIQKVGVRNVDVPLYVLQKDGHTQFVAANVSLSVSLSEVQKGAHLSRFIIQLAEESKSKAFCYKLDSFLAETKRRLQAQAAHIEIGFRYFADKQSPVTGHVAPMAYPCSFEASLDHEGNYHFILGVEVPIATLCPCSKEISDYGAHNQRALVRAKVLMDTHTDHEVVWIEDLVEAIDACASCPVYPVLKREDEKYVTERAYDNPKFVEDVIRECITALDAVASVSGFTLEVEALESIHSHNAWAFHTKNMPNSA